MLLKFIHLKDNTNLFKNSINIISLFWILIHLYVSLKLAFSIDQLIILHVGIASIIIFANHYLKKKNPKYLKMIFLLGIIMSIIITFTFLFSYNSIVQRVGLPTTSDIFLGTIWILLVLFATYLEWGFIIPILVFLTALYAVFGNHTSGILFHSGISFSRFIGYCSTYFMGTLGQLPRFSATLIIHFILFGSLLLSIGGEDFVRKIGLILSTKYKSGAAQAAVFSSLFMGMLSGSIPANVAMTGTFTIPMMKKRGYSAEYAGAVESVASSGGQIMPPIMSVVAFLIAGLTGIPYAKIVIAAFLPALVYYLSLSFNVFIRTQKIGIQLLEVTEEIKSISFKNDIIKKHGFLIIPIIVLTWRILIGETPSRAALWGNISILIVGLLNALLSNKKKSKIESILNFLKDIYQGIINTSNSIVKIAVILSSVGIIMETFTTTGFGQRLSYFIVSTNLEVWMLVVLIALMVLFFGMGMPSAGAYLIAVLLSAPTLINLGFELLSVHMFVFYFAILSALTPPVCLAVLVAISISKGNFLNTALKSLQLAIPGILMPFFFLYKPIILKLQNSPFAAIKFNIFLLVAICGLAISIEGYFIKKVNFYVRVFCFLSASLVVFCSGVFNYLGICAIFSIIFYQIIEKRIAFIKKA